MSFLRRRTKPQPARPPQDQTWRRPKLVIPIDHKAYEAEWGAFVEDAISDADVMKARVRSYGADHE